MIVDVLHIGGSWMGRFFWSRVLHRVASRTIAFLLSILNVAVKERRSQFKLVEVPRGQGHSRDTGVIEAR
jgi:hypothetical protein